MAKVSSMSMSGIAAAGFQVIADSGYTKFCLLCGGRHGGALSFIGQDRDLSSEDCGPCRVKNETVKELRECKTKKAQILLARA